MELSQSRPYGAEGRKPTRDFLSLYSHPTAQQDPRPPCQGNYIKTHDFLQPLERVEKGCAKEEKVTLVDTPPPPPLLPVAPVEHVLPGGIGTYSITHINSYLNPIIRAPKPEGADMTNNNTNSANNIVTERNEESSFCSSYGGSGFTLWDESAAKKGKTGKENMRNNPGVLDTGAGGRVGQWGSLSSERPSQSSSNNHRGNFSSPSSSQPSGQRSQSFMEMIKSAKGSTSQEDELEEEDHFALKKEISSATITANELRVKVEGKSSDQKANTPRSKHSATEQRRRSKINDRFQMLRGLIPHGDQKRDKASFLLEVIEYIQFLQDKVQKYEGPFQGWNNEHTKLMPWRNNPSQGVNGGPGPASLVFAAKLDEKPLPAPSLVVSEPIANKGTAFPLPLQPNFFNPVRNSSEAVPSAPLRQPSDDENKLSQSQLSQACQLRSGNKLEEEDMAIEGGTISLSSTYSQGLLTTLTQALQSSGVDLSQASISVKIELGKRAKNGAKDDEIFPENHGVKHSRALTADDSDQLQKKLKTNKT